MSDPKDIEVIGMLRALARAKKLDDADALLDRMQREKQDRAKRDAEYQALQDIGKSAAQSIAEMVAALECDYDRLEELREIRDVVEIAEELVELETAAGECESRDDAEQRIQEDPLSIEVRSGWETPALENPKAEEFRILLGTGGPATRIIGELDEHGEPTRARIQAQDWFKPWTDYTGDAISQDDLLTYCRCFYFGE